MTFSPQNSLSPFLSEELTYPDDDRTFREILSKRQRSIANIVNIKENAQYEKVELLTAQRWFTQYFEGAILSSYTFRITCDLVQMNGAPIPTGVTTITLSTTTIPAAINIPTAIQPTDAFGASNNATNFFFLNDPSVYVNTNVWTNASQQIIITNNSGSTLTQCVWGFNYIKT